MLARRSSVTPAIAVALALCAACGAAPGFHRTEAENAPVRAEEQGNGDPYAIRMDWPVAEGDRARVTWTLDRTEATRLTPPSGEIETGSKRTTMLLRAIEEVLEVDEQGGATSLVLHVEEMAFDETGASPVQLKNTTVRIDRAHRANEASVTVDGAPASPAVRDALDEAISFELPGGPTDDTVFGASEPRRLGASWTIDAELARRYLQRGKMRIPRGAVTGQMRLAETFEEDGATYLQLEGKLDVRRFDFEHLDGGATVERGAMSTQVVNVVPASSPRKREEQAITTKTEMVVAIPSRGHLHVTTEEATTWAYEALPDRPQKLPTTSPPPRSTPEI